MKLRLFNQVFVIENKANSKNKLSLENIFLSKIFIALNRTAKAMIKNSYKSLKMQSIKIKMEPQNQTFKYFIQKFVISMLITILEMV